ncbi:nucleoside-diphosphate-sugar epimerase [Marisediminicola sp. UYEF4]
MAESSSDPHAAFAKANAAGTVRLAEQAILAGVDRLVYVSSIKAQGEGGPSSYAVTDASSPTDAYGLSKLRAEEGLRRLEREFEFGIVILRPPLVYGGGVGGNLLRLMKIIERGIPLPLASVHNQRAMISVDNFTNIIALCIGPDFGTADAVLVADSESLSTADIIRELAAGLGRRPRLFPFPPRLLELAGSLSGRRPEVERLIGDLKVITNISQFIPNYTEVVATRVALRATGRVFASRSDTRAGD